MSGDYDTVAVNRSDLIEMRKHAVAIADRPGVHPTDRNHALDIQEAITELLEDDGPAEEVAP